MKYYTEEQIKTTSLLQIWFSSCWDTETSNSFDMLVKEALTNPERFQLDTEKDVPILENWQKVTITKKKAILVFPVCHLKSYFDNIWHLKTEMDRLKFCRYLSTGCIFVDEKKIICGNKTMFAEVFGSKWITNELFFKAIDLTANGFSNKQNSASLYDTIVKVTHTTIQGFRSFVNMEKIICILQQKVIDPTKEPEFADTIKALRPYSIDWSNVPDYLEKNSFIKFAEACSVDGTMHSVHFRTWDEYVFGACHVDWKDRQDECLALYQKLKASKERSYESLESSGTANSILSFFKSAPYINTLDEINMLLAHHFRRIFEDFFLSDGQGNVLKRFEVGKSESFPLCFFEHSHSIIWSAFSFSKEMKIRREEFVVSSPLELTANYYHN